MTKPQTFAEQIAARLPASAAELPLIELIALVLAAKKAIEDEESAAFEMPF